MVLYRYAANLQNMQAALHFSRVARSSTPRLAAAFSSSPAISPEDAATFASDGFVIIRGLLSPEEVDLVRQAIETDESLATSDNQIQLNDEAGGKTKFSLWSNPGDGTLGMLTRSRRVVDTAQTLLGGNVMHYHSKNLVKYPREGGVWNWHQVVIDFLSSVPSYTCTFLFHKGLRLLVQGFFSHPALAHRLLRNRPVHQGQRLPEAAARFERAWARRPLEPRRPARRRH